MNSSSTIQYLLIVEDDIDQMELLLDFAGDEIRKLIENENTNDQQKQILKQIQVVKVTNIESLQKALSAHKNIFMALLDCNIPDTKDGQAHDQLIKTNHRITGQHKSVDIVTQNLPGTPITMISSMNRFQKIVTQYYKNKRDISVNFINKSDQAMIKRNIGYYIRLYLRKLA